MSYALYAALYARFLRAFGGNTTASCRDRLLRQVSSPGASPLSAPFLVSDTPLSFSLFKAVFRGTLYLLYTNCMYLSIKLSVSVEFKRVNTYVQDKEKSKSKHNGIR